MFPSTVNLQQVRGLDPLMAGLAFLGPSAGAALGGPVSGRLAARNKPFAVMGIGCTVAAVSLAVLAASTNFAVYLVALTACGFTMGFVYAFTTVATQAVVAPERAAKPPVSPSHHSSRSPESGSRCRAACWKCLSTKA